MTLLILGGTADARHICQQLHAQLAPSCQLIYSIAGLVRTPNVAAQVISGGFSQFGGLTTYLQSNKIQGVIDATHPYASQMSSKAAQATQALGLPLWRLLRPAWQAQTGDQWVNFATRAALFTGLQSHARILLSLGQVGEQELASLSADTNIFLRTAAKPKLTLPANVTWLKAIGPFSLADERQLLDDIQVTVIASKNSGGDATSAKLQAARERQLPVYMLQRPLVSTYSGGHTFADSHVLVDRVLAFTNQVKAGCLPAQA